MRILLASLFLAGAISAQSITYEHLAPNCGGLDFLSSLTSGCAGDRIKVMAHPANPAAAGFFLLIAYRSLTFGLPIVQPRFTMERDEHGDFVAILPSGDMTEVIVSGKEVDPGDLVLGTAKQ